MSAATSCQSASAYKFGAIEFKTRGAGVFFCSELLLERIRKLPPDDLRAANREAWKLRRKADRLTERYSNVSVHGSSLHDDAMHMHSVAKAICDVTWKALQS